MRITLLAGLAAGAMASAAGATSLSITVTNTQGAGGLSVTPLYAAFHNGSFDAFNANAPASVALKALAETGDASGLRAQRLAADPSSQGVQLAAPSGPPPLQPGQSATTKLDLTPGGPLYLSFLAMLLPSNDHFIGNDDALAYQIFDAAGNFTGDRVINVTGAQIYDAGTEANGLTGAAFVAGANIADNPTGEGTIQQGIGLSAELLGQQLATGGTLNAGAIDFTSNPDAFGLLTISIAETAPVPVPASAPLLLGAFGLLGWTARRRAQR